MLSRARTPLLDPARAGGRLPRRRQLLALAGVVQRTRMEMQLKRVAAGGPGGREAGRQTRGMCRMRMVRRRGRKRGWVAGSGAGGERSASAAWKSFTGQTMAQQHLSSSRRNLQRMMRWTPIAGQARGSASSSPAMVSHSEHHLVQAQLKPIIYIPHASLSFKSNVVCCHYCQSWPCFVRSTCGLSCTRFRLHVTFRPCIPPLGELCFVAREQVSCI